jgi:hypothetical protein
MLKVGAKRKKIVKLSAMEVKKFLSILISCNIQPPKRLLGDNNGIN